MKAFKLGKKKEPEVIKIEVIPRLEPPKKLPLRLFKNVHPPKHRQEFYFSRKAAPSNGVVV